MEVAACMTAVEQGLSAGEVMRRLTAEDYAVDTARRHLARAEKWFNIGCLIQLAVVVAVVLFLIFGKY